MRNKPIQSEEQGRNINKKRKTWKILRFYLQSIKKLTQIHNYRKIRIGTCNYAQYHGP